MAVLGLPGSGNLEEEVMRGWSRGICASSASIHIYQGAKHQEVEASKLITATTP